MLSLVQQEESARCSTASAVCAGAERSVATARDATSTGDRWFVDLRCLATDEITPIEPYIKIKHTCQATEVGQLNYELWFLKLDL